MGEGLVERLKQDGMELDVTWVPFELHPETPAEGVPVAEYFGSHMGQFEQTYVALQRRAGAMGLPLAPIEQLVNTHRAFLLTEWVREHMPALLPNLQHELFSAYFASGKNLADESVLEAICDRLSIPREAIQAADGYEKLLAEAREEARLHGVSGAPTFIINDTHKIVGALPYDRLRDALRQIEQESAR